MPQRPRYVHTKVITMVYTRFEWDEVKHKRNILKHGISFPSASTLFDHPHLTRLDERLDYGEERWSAIGWIGPLIGVVVFSEYEIAGELRIIRLISARKASKHEVRLYEKEIAN